MSTFSSNLSIHKNISFYAFFSNFLQVIPRVYLGGNYSLKEKGAIVYDLITNRLYYSDGMEWKEMGGGGDNPVRIQNADDTTSVSTETDPPTSSQTIKFRTSGRDVGNFDPLGELNANFGINLQPYPFSFNTHPLRFYELPSNGTEYVAFQAPNSISNSTTYILPSSDGVNGDALRTNGSGTLSWGSSNSFADNVFNIYDNSDTTKRIFFQAQFISTGTSRTFTAPNYDGLLPAVDLNRNVMLGNTSYAMDSGTSNTYIGYDAGRQTNLGSLNVAVGREALRDLLGTSGNTAIGYQALQSCGSFNNVGIGYRAGRVNVNGSFNTIVGSFSLENATNSFQNVAIGYQVMQSSIFPGPNNIAIGNLAMDGCIGGARNIAIGPRAMGGAVTSSENVAIGDQSLLALTTGTENIAIGPRCLRNVVNGNSNTGMGHEALLNTTGNQNTAIGPYALYTLGSASSNTSIGYNSGRNATIGDFNTFIGTSAGSGIISGLENVVIGGNAQRTNDVSRCIVLGYSAEASADDQMVIRGNMSGTVVLVGGSATVSAPNVTISTRILLTSQQDGGTPGFLRVSSRVSGTSFTITSSSVTDTSTIAYFMFEP